MHVYCTNTYTQPPRPAIHIAPYCASAGAAGNVQVAASAAACSVQERDERLVHRSSTPCQLLLSRCIPSPK